ncbi:hypothetical protein LINPERPRIM_LOCUS38564 [Linum perenne]
MLETEWCQISYPTTNCEGFFSSIPITSVAYESAFSVCGGLLDPHKSRLYYSTIEAIVEYRSRLNYRS